MARGKGKLTEASAPTMIVPRGTEIEVDAHGQLSVRAPGNLVIQNSGSYGTIESRAGSIRIDQGVEVEAVSVRCAEDCYVLGSLTAWKVTARTLHLEAAARANVVLQETERLEVGRGAKLVGNFDSEKELFVLFSRYAREFRSMPFFFARDGEGEPAPPRLEGPLEGPSGARPPRAEATGPPAAARSSGSASTIGSATASVTGNAGSPSPRPGGADLPEPLFFALVLLDRDLGRGNAGHSTERILREIVKLLREGDLETLRFTYRTLLGRLQDPRPDVRRAAELIDTHFAGR